MDPVHGFILIKEPWLLRLVDTPEFQRLRRVRQLGASFGTYHGAEHTRFGHSLGALHVMTRILRRLEEIDGPLPEEEATVAKSAALLHDVGHGPLSHALENLLTPGVDHEGWTRRILLGDTGINAVLRSVDETLPAQVAAVIDRRYEAGWVNDLVTSQLDVDRMDYLLRDALFTGADYGRFQLERVINTLVLHEGRVAVQLKGLQAIEEYVLARHFMYWRVYFHKTIRGQDLLLRAALARAHKLMAEGRQLPPLAVPFARPESVSLADYVAVDDADLFVALKAWTRSDDDILADLSARFLRRDLLKPIFPVSVPSLPAGLEEAARDIVQAAGYDADSYCLVDTTANVPYDTYAPGERDDASRDDASRGDVSQPIRVLRNDGGTDEISTASALIRSLANQRVQAVNLYVPAECRSRVKELSSDY